jgi:regulator of PEP synthase PpsR (kinase-PPPase family)
LVFFVSDRTGKTSELIAQSLLTQFDGIEFEYKTFPFITTQADAKKVATEIEQKKLLIGQKPLVFSTLVDPDLQEIIVATDAFVISLFSEFIEPLEEALQMESSHTIGMPHEEYDAQDYKGRIDAIDFTMKNDDGIKTSQFDKADVILIGVSRSGKTPTCLYLALNFSLKAANYPLTEDDLSHDTIPEFLLPFSEKIIGLTIQADQLSAIRQQRRPKSDYSSLNKCKTEIKLAETMMKKAGVYVVDSTAMSIEEIAVNIVKEKQLLHGA